MKIWKIWVTGSVVVLVFGATALCTALWNNLSTEWTAEQSSAQYALDHSPINHISKHQQFTADGLEQVFYGTDAFHHGYYVFVQDDRNLTKAIPAAGLLSEANITKHAEAQNVVVRSIAIGYIEGKTAANGQGQSPVVYEVYGQNRKGANGYYYYDATSGSLLWQYVLST